MHANKAGRGSDNNTHTHTHTNTHTHTQTEQERLHSQTLLHDILTYYYINALIYWIWYLYDNYWFSVERWGSNQLTAFTASNINQGPVSTLLTSNIKHFMSFIISHTNAFVICCNLLHFINTPLQCGLLDRSMFYDSWLKQKGNKVHSSLNDVSGVSNSMPLVLC